MESLHSVPKHRMRVVSASPFAIIRSIRFPSFRELALLAAIIVVGMLAFRVFDEWRGPIQILFWLSTGGLMAFFIGRAFWSWWSAQPTSIATRGAVGALGFAVVGWLDVALARAVTGISEGNYALILIAPLTMLLGLFVSLGGMLAAGVGVAATATSLTRPVENAVLVATAGLAAVILNVGHIVALVRILWGD